MISNRRKRALGAALATALLLTAPALAKKGGGGPTRTSCSAQVIVGSAGAQVLVYTSDRKVDRADIFLIEEEELTFLAEVAIVRQPSGLYGAIVSLAVEVGSHYEVQFVQETHKGERVRCTAGFSVTEPGGCQGGFAPCPLEP